MSLRKIKEMEIYKSKTDSHYYIVDRVGSSNVFKYYRHFVLFRRIDNPHLKFVASLNEFKKSFRKVTKLERMLIRTKFGI